MKDKILKILNKKATSEEKDAFYKDIANNEDLADKYSKYKCDYIFNNLPYCCNIETNAGHERKAKIYKVCRIITSIAAILSIPLFIYFICNFPKDKSQEITLNTNESSVLSEIIYKRHTETPMIKYKTNVGVVGEVLLPDSSTVILNSGSQIEFPAEFDNDERIINFYGEGYFNIKSNKEWPMKINTTNGISVIVTGTEFNLNNYDNNPQFKLALVDGNLSIFRETSNSVVNVSKNNEIIINKVGEGTTTAYRKVINDFDCITSWIDGKIIFKNTLMTDIANSLSNWYGYNIIIYNQKIKDYRFTGEFHSESLFNILETISISSNINFSIMEKDVIIY